ncbi:hypothetical protein [Streptomyces chryseus]|uniref:hypothetical protein n=1 Tax=Streptomyces chryseus TaxID=68186 RepID=UPI0020125ED3|nr:hypothetical protein [Streptomyces chryseus]
MSSTPPLSRPVFDPFAHHPSLATLRTACHARDWGTVSDFFAALGDEDERAYASSVVADLPGREHLLEQASAAHPGDPLPRTLLADRYIRIGWSIRSNARASKVSEAQFGQFHSWLRRAEGLLIEVCAEHPAYALAWCHRVTTARGLQLGASEARRRYDRLAEHHPHHYAAQAKLLQQLCPKWGGSWEAAEGFARACAADAPPGGNNGALVAEVHMERWLDLDEGPDAAHMSAHAVRDELLAAARRSVLHPEYRPGFHWVTAHGHFAAALSLGRHHAEAAPHFRALGNMAGTFPWTYLGDQEAAFIKHRKTALAKG